MQKISPCLWFDGNAEEAVNFYLSVFENSMITKVSHYGEAGPGPKGKVMAITFQLEGQDFMAINGGPQYKFTPAISLAVDCASQAEVDTLWGKLLQGGESQGCGWVQDNFGVSWQIVPTVLGDMLSDKNAAKSARVMRAMLPMQKLDIAALTRAYEQE